jgi:hypothetical protein
MVRRVIVPRAHQSSNPGFDICVSHKGEILFKWEATFPSDQIFRDAHRDRVCVPTFIGVSICSFMSASVCSIVFL